MKPFFRRLFGFTKKTLYVTDVAGFRIDSQRYEHGIIQDGRRYCTAIAKLDDGYPFPCTHIIFRSHSKRTCKKLHHRICTVLKDERGVDELNTLIVYGSNLLNKKGKGDRVY